MWQWSARVGPSLVDALQDGRTSVKPAVLELDLGGFLIRDLQWMLLAAWVDRLTYVWNSLPFFWALQQFLPACRSLVLVLCCAGRIKVQSCTTICRGIGPPNLGFRSTHCNSSESWWDWVGGDSVEFPSFFCGRLQVSGTVLLRRRAKGAILHNSSQWNWCTSFGVFKVTVGSGFWVLGLHPSQPLRIPTGEIESGDSVEIPPLFFLWALQKIHNSLQE